MNKILLIAALLLAVLFSVFAISGVRYIVSDGTVYKGIGAARLLSAEKNQWKGELTPDVLAEIVSEEKAIDAQYPGDEGVSDDVYAQKEQSYMDIEDMINSMLSKEDDYNPYAIRSLTKGQAQDIYAIRQSNIKQVIKEEATTSEQQKYLKTLYQKEKTPFYYEAAESWKAISLLGEEYSLVIVLLVGFLAAGIFSDEFQYKADAIFFSTKCGRTKAVHAKIRSGLIITTIVYWICMAVYTAISLSVMGVGGVHTSIQTEWCYGIYSMTYGQYYLTILLSGFIASLLSASIAMLLSAQLHSATIASCIPFVLFCVSPFLGRAIPFHTFFNLTPDQLMNVCNSVKNVIVYQMGQTVFRPIPFVMGFYLILAIVMLPLTYRVFHRA